MKVVEGRGKKCVEESKRKANTYLGEK